MLRPKQYLTIFLLIMCWSLLADCAKASAQSAPVLPQLKSGATCQELFDIPARGNLDYAIKHLDSPVQVNWQVVIRLYQPVGTFTGERNEPALHAYHVLSGRITDPDFTGKEKVCLLKIHGLPVSFLNTLQTGDLLYVTGDLYSSGRDVVKTPRRETRVVSFGMWHNVTAARMPSPGTSYDEMFQTFLQPAPLPVITKKAPTTAKQATLKPSTPSVTLKPATLKPVSIDKMRNR